MGVGLTLTLKPSNPLPWFWQLLIGDRNLCKSIVSHRICSTIIPPLSNYHFLHIIPSTTSQHIAKANDRCVSCDYQSQLAIQMKRWHNIVFKEIKGTCIQRCWNAGQYRRGSKWFIENEAQRSKFNSWNHFPMRDFIISSIVASSAVASWQIYKSNENISHFVT